MYKCTNIHIYTHSYIYACIYMYTYTHTTIHTNAYIYTNTHAFIYTYIYIIYVHVSSYGYFTFLTSTHLEREM